MLPVAIASIDYVKRADVLPSVVACRWDVLVVDEAHGAAGDSDRRAAAGALAARAACVLLLTATPHNGDAHAFNALCNTGSACRSAARLQAHASRREAGRRPPRASASRAAERRRSPHARAARRVHARRPRRTPLGGRLAAAGGAAQAGALQRAIARTVGRAPACRAWPAAPAGDVHQLDLPLADPDGELDAGDDAPAWAARPGAGGRCPRTASARRPGRRRAHGGRARDEDRRDRPPAESRHRTDRDFHRVSRHAGRTFARRSTVPCWSCMAA